MSKNVALHNNMLNLSNLIKIAKKYNFPIETPTPHHTYISSYAMILRDNITLLAAYQILLINSYNECC